MILLVCIKQVPDTTEIKIDPETNTLIRAGVPSIVNPFDAYALEAAARVKDTFPDSKIIVISMGPEQAKVALKDCLAIAADKAYLVSDRVFSGSDTLATSYILSEAITKVAEIEGAIDIILCGKQAIDGDTAQVGPEIAEYLDYPQVTCALELYVKDGRLEVKKEVEEGLEMIALNMPCLVTVTKPSFEPRMPTIKRKLAASRAEIAVLSQADLNVDSSRIGLKGSPTKVKKTFTPPRKEGGVIIAEKTAGESAAQLFALISAAHVL